jgi:DNA-binding response OmpR family regulator
MEKILLIDDDIVMVDLLRTLLEIEGFSVSALPDGEDVLALIKEVDPEMILLDVNLNDYRGVNLDGFKLLGQIRECADLEEIKIIMTSGMDFSAQSVDKGADGFLHKPYMPDELVNLIKEILG